MTEQPPNWIEAFKAKHGRAPRILHVGNIANNAYQNAKILNAAGADCDVLCADYYHVMGAPEWEDAEFYEPIKNTNYPPWHKMNLHGFQRPRWFAAAPRRVAIAYLLARRAGNEAEAEKLWQQMDKIYRYFCFRENSILKKPLLGLEQLAFKMLAALRGGGGSHKQETPATSHTPPDAPVPLQDALHQRVARDAKRFFPDREMTLGEGWSSDYTPEAAALYAPLFACYDIIQGYATDPIWPYLANVKNYVAFEHGTLRDMPFDNTDTSNLAMVAYARSKAIMVTNTDCVDSADIVTHTSGTPYVCGLHGIPVEDIAHYLDGLTPPDDLSARFGVPKGIPVFFCPSRHSYLPESGQFIKGNDLVVKAAALLAEKGLDFRLVLAGWGEDTAMIRKMVAQTPSLAGRTLWTPPLGKKDFSLKCLSVDGVLDQFTLPVFGAIAFEVLATGTTPLISKRVADQRMTRFFGSPMPYFPCDTPEEIAEAMAHIIAAPGEAAQLAKAGRQWALACHSNQKILEKNCQLYQHTSLV